MTQLVIPKHHGEKLTDIPDDQLNEILPVVKRLVAATGAENYNVLQNNGRLAHQEVDHVCCSCLEFRVEHDGWDLLIHAQVHFHLIPKPNSLEGLGIEWPAQKTDMDKLKQLYAQIQAKM